MFYQILLFPSFALFSTLMVFTNKSISSHFTSFPLVLIIQSIFTFLSVMIWKLNVSWNLSTAKKWFPCAILFGFNLYSSMAALKYMHVSTFMVVRNMQPILVSVLNYALYKKTIAISSVFYLFIAFGGSCVYSSKHFWLNFQGSLWAVLNTISMSLYVIAVKEKNETMQMETLDMVFYNNAISSILFVCVFLLESNATSFGTTFLLINDCYYNKNYCFFKIFFSCIVGFALSIAGMECQKILSPTSWLTYNNFVKLLIITLSCYTWELILDQTEKLGLILSFCGIILYGMQWNNKTIQLKVNIILAIAVCIVWHVFDF